jgi:asparagine synthase (glutamine-hydrolysing)
MSCIAGIVNLDGAPVDHASLERMTSTMKHRAPDGDRMWCSENVGLGHAMLRTSSACEDPHQPCTLDGQVWITADARLDGREELVARLRSAGEQVRNDASEAELILHAYRVYGEGLLEHVAGDFAFALWDNRVKTLFCARDHFGVRPFYYAKTDRVFVFASDIDALRVHPAVSTRLDEAAIGDFLMLGQYQAAELTVYRDVRRLPAASRIRVARDECHVHEYWELPPQDWMRYRQPSTYVEHFQDVFARAVTDRLGATSIALELSGGMDSTSIAAVAAAHAETNGTALAAFTVTANRFYAEDREGHYSAMVASNLSIPIALWELGEHRLFERYGNPELRTAEPSAIPHRAFSYDVMARLTRAGARVLISGQGGDEVLGSSSRYLPHLLRRGRLGELFVEVISHLRRTGSLRGMGVRSALAESMGRRPQPAQTPGWRPAFPDWLDEGFVGRNQLRDRWEAAWQRMVHRTDPDQRLREWALSQVFSSYETFNLPLVARHPFFDLRLVTFLLGVPNFMKFDKKVLREAMHVKLPQAVRGRPKTPAVGDVVRAALTRNLVSVPIGSQLSMVASGYIEPGRYMKALERYLGGEGAESTWSSAPIVAPVCLNYWLSQPAGSFNR